MRDDHAGRQLQQRIEAAAVQRKIFNKLPIYYRADRCICGVQIRMVGDHRNGLRGGTYVKNEIARKIILHVERNAGHRNGLKALLADLHRIVARLQIGDVIKTLLISLCAPSHACIGITNLHFHAGNRGIGLVRHLPGYGCKLRKGSRRYQPSNHQRYKEKSERE